VYSPGGGKRIPEADVGRKGSHGDEDGLRDQQSREEGGDVTRGADLMDTKSGVRLGPSNPE